MTPPTFYQFHLCLFEVFEQLCCCFSPLDNFVLVGICLGVSYFSCSGVYNAWGDEITVVYLLFYLIIIKHQITVCIIGFEKFCLILVKYI